MLGRDTPWRQGSLVLTKHLLELEVSLPSGGEDDYLGVIVTHDCDLLSPVQEPSLELIVARAISVIDPDYIYAKHPRELHLTFHR